MTAHPIRLGVLDDDQEDVILLRRNLSKIPGFEFHLKELELDDGGRCSSSWQWHDVDILFLDYLLGCCTGLDVLESIRGCGDPMPIILLTGQKDEKIAAALIQAGADEYVDKLDATPEVLQRCIRRAMSRIEQFQTCEPAIQGG